MAYDGFDLAGKTALITGGNSGIGLGMAKALAAAGADVCIWGTNADKNAQAERSLAGAGRQVRAMICDVSDETAVEATFAATVDAFGGVDACFVNAGVSGRGQSFLDMTTEEWRRVLDVNLDGAFYTLRAATRHMAGQESGGAIVVTASLAALEGQPRGEHYAASKGALIAMMRAIAVEFARSRIRANAIVPGWIHTDMTEKFLDSDVVRERVLPRVPMRRWGSGDDFGALAVYLASDASAYHTGDTFVIDGAYSLF